MLSQKIREYAPKILPEVWFHRPNANRIFLTFDDGPHPDVTVKLLEFFAEKRISATFFLSGQQLFRYRHQLDKTLYAGHSLGIHGFHHRPFNLMSREQQRRQILQTAGLITKLFGETPVLFRPPYGYFNDDTIAVTRELQKQMVLWSVMAYDFKWSEKQVDTQLKKQVQPGDIIVFHDSQMTEAVLLPVIKRFVEYCEGNGWDFAKL
jgi:peptidoglycan/xylan/chitin deacetylase (PgdA/CDA1 family)